MKTITAILSLAGGCAVLLLATGCATQVVPQHIRDTVTPGVSFPGVRENPDAHVGQIVMWAGEVLAVNNVGKGTSLEILEIPAYGNGEPRSREKSEGRFLVTFDQFMDEAVYQQGRRVTVVGTMQGSRRQPLGAGKVEYAYPLLEGRYIYLWPRPQNDTVDPFYWHNRYYYGYPYWDPWWGPDPYRLSPYPRGDRREDCSKEHLERAPHKR